MSDDAPIASAEEIRSLFERTFALADRVRDSFHARRENLPPGSQSRWEDVTLALAFATRAAGALGDPSLLPLALRGYELLMDIHERRFRGPRVASAAGVAELVRARPKAPPEASSLVRHRDPSLRVALAWGLRADDLSARPLLDALAKDPVPAVRTVAAQRLGEAVEVPWWWGRFQSDPAQRIATADAERCRPALEQIHQLLSEGGFNRSELAEAVRGLPDALAVELLENLLGGAGFGLAPELLAELWRRPGAAEATQRLCLSWQRNGETALAVKWPAASAAAPLPEDARIALARRLLELGQELPRDDLETAGAIAAACITALWPPGGDLGPILDAVLAAPQMAEAKTDWFMAELESLFAAAGANLDSVADRLLAAAAEDWPGPWQRAGWRTRNACKRLPPARLREVAERAMAERDPNRRRWALPLLLGPAHDAERDPPRPELVRRFFADPEVRGLFFESAELCEQALPLVRAELRAGRLGFTEIYAVMAAIGRVFGGVASSREMGQERVERRSKRNAELEPYLGPAELRGPPTEAEWEIWRAARRAHAAQGGEKEWYRLLSLLPEGPWRPEDREILEQALGAFRAGDRVLAFPIGSALAAKPSRDDLPLFRELAVGDDEDDLEILEHQEAMARAQLGLPPSADEDGAEAPPARKDDWLDEED